ncbi:hypothetical protein LAZ40_09855 [Cereibacter sphaeroides]|uniref:hypothetical protein n=1 Tax=Cereibacter sphaeroides TaxID=1063 RepID=UPI001F2E3EBF|nr:hypothetical protein [Cereibacter sphaeroides]MCE6959355.1 hypothetical protein [Cereibacter sphaeroides]MCE6972947.1 hypothetical protein [Cereibacter sphaeroides]
MTIDHELASSASDLLVLHAQWPTPHDAWAKLFTATLLLHEIARPLQLPAEERHVRVATVILRDLFTRTALAGDVRPFRAFFPIVREKSPFIAPALRKVEEEIRAEGDRGAGQKEAVDLLTRLREDAEASMIRGLTGGIGADAAEEDRPDLAEDFRNPEDLRRGLEAIAEAVTEDLLEWGLGEAGQEGFLHRFNILVNLREALVFLRSGKPVKASTLRQRMVEESLQEIVERLAEVPESHDRQMFLRLLHHLSLRSQPVGDAMEALRDYARGLGKAAESERVRLARGRPLPRNLEGMTVMLRDIKRAL